LFFIFFVVLIGFTLRRYKKNPELSKFWDEKVFLCFMAHATDYITVLRFCRKKRQHVATTNVKTRASGVHPTRGNTIFAPEKQVTTIKKLQLCF
jgi:hypothetical protein